MAKKLMIYCDRCAAPVQDWQCVPSRHNVRFYDLTVYCHGETESYRVSVNDLIHGRDPGAWYIIAFEDFEPKSQIQTIELPRKSLSINIGNPTNKLARDT